MKRTIQALCVITAIFLISKIAFAGPTIVEGNVSGTWDLAGSPYIFIDDCTVPTGEVLVIDPGVEVVIGESISFNIYGQVVAVGTKSQHITFRAINDDIQFKQVYVVNGSSAPPVSEFNYCNFRNAEIGLYLHAYGRINNNYTTMQTNISKCNFESSVTTAIYARAQAVDASQYMTPKRRHARVNPVVTGCNFKGNNSGIEMYMQGAGSAYYSHGTTAAIIQNNIFYNQTVAALNMLSGSLNSGYPTFMNNTIVNCDRGVWIHDSGYDVVMKNNIFYSTSTAIERTGTLSAVAYYNCFFNNTTNFSGYPATYGDIVMLNINGTPCDLGQNIFLDPIFVNTTDAHLTKDSPCIGAGTEEDAPVDDIDGDSRPQGNGFDIGADEFFVMEVFANAGPDQIICSQLCDGAVLDGRKSYALNSAITSYDWELVHRDDAGYNQTATGETPTILDLATGIYDVTLTITDDANFQATDQMILSVIETCNGCSIMKGDLDSDGDVDGEDLRIFSQNYGTVVLIP